MRAPALTALAVYLALSVSVFIGSATAQLANDPAELSSVPPAYPREPWTCSTVYEWNVGQRRYCGTMSEFVRAVLICRARYEALSNREQNSMIGINLNGHCNALQQAKDSGVAWLNARVHERQRIEDAHRQLRALGVNQ